MLINFNIEKLDKLLYDFYNITGLTISVWNSQFKQLSYQPKEMKSFCRIIKSSPEGSDRCYQCDKKLCTECGKTGKPATNRCHAGLIDTAIPIKFKNIVMGYIMFGQAVDKNHLKNEPLLEKICRELNLNLSELTESYNELEVYDEANIDSAANILKAATRYIWLSEYIEIDYNVTASQINSYIKSNVGTDLSVPNICNALGISKNHLYEASHKYFHMTIGEYIAHTRIEEAKELLASTKLSVSQISNLVGIKNYNYFTKFFKKHVGTPPLKYRRLLLNSK